MSYTYLAAPYSSENKKVRKNRAQFASNAAAYLMARGEVVFSPLSQGHAIARHLCEDTRYDQEFWMTQSIGMLRGAGRLVVLLIDGVWDSAGVEQEMVFAENVGIPIETLAVGVNAEGEFEFSYSLDIDDDEDDECAGCAMEALCSHNGTMH